MANPEQTEQVEAKAQTIYAQLMIDRAPKWSDLTDKQKEAWYRAAVSAIASDLLFEELT